MAAPVKVLEYIVLEETSGFAWSHASPSACTVETIKELLSSQHPDTDSSDRLRILPRNGGSSHLLSSYVSADDDKLNSWGFVHDPCPSEPYNKLKFYLAVAPKMATA
ncbi:hypothetical protein H4R21_002958 [Coemansia helicoidea]|uniref:Uncharacterized protein n=1 Tax=Coemansia helicoidea TaxID=1286919 RepID=A0ACC1L4H5_9FUNG|nr:hypothetical protein H4R21_002958 [Coemansia helicoidea]